MSTYYEFYLGKKTSDGKVAMVAPFEYNLKSGEFERKPILCRSRGFIDWEDFNFMEKFEIHEMTDYDVNFFAFDNLWGTDPNEKYSVSYYCSYAAMAHAGAKAGFRQGYVELSDFNSIIKNGYEIDYEYDHYMISAEQYAEMPAAEQTKYGKMAYLVRNSVDRVARILVDATIEMVGWDDSDYVFICRVC